MVGRSGAIALAVMAKAPVAGEAKTRLGAGIGYPQAATLYRAFVLDTLAAVGEAAARRPTARRLIVCPDERHRALLGPLAGAEWTIVAQRRRGLMGGIADAFARGFAEGARAVVVVDADSPLALDEHLERCVELLAAHDVVLGPTADGGYYLIGARSRAAESIADLLLGTAYDSATICTATADRARALGHVVGFGPTGFDVDTSADLDALETILDIRDCSALRHTREALGILGQTPVATV